MTRESEILISRQKQRRTIMPPENERKGEGRKKFGQNCIFSTFHAKDRITKVTYNYELLPPNLIFNRRKNDSFEN